jgi:hypothetical protein
LYPINGVKSKNVVGIRLLVMASMRATQAHELAKVMNYQDIEIGIAIGILRQRNLIPARS